MLANTPDRDTLSQDPNGQARRNKMSAQEGMLEVTGSLSPQHQAIFPVEAQTLLSLLCEQFAPRVDELLAAREVRQATIDGGQLPDFLPETQDIREGSWKILGIPDDLQDRPRPSDHRSDHHLRTARCPVLAADRTGPSLHLRRARRRDLGPDRPRLHCRRFGQPAHLD